MTGRPLRRRSLGPGALTAAAFLGPGTVTTATVAGARLGYVLAWALVFATVAAIVLQEMAARLGVAGRLGLGEAIARSAPGPVLRWGAVGLVAAALGIGNAAYEGGNVAGAVLGLQAALPHLQADVLAPLVALVAGGVLLLGGYRVIERFLIGSVLVMTVTFAAALLVVGPDWRALAVGAAVPSLPPGAMPLVLGLIGTTIVPYNLFLHAAAARTHWPDADSLAEARFDAGVSIGVGGLVSILVLATAAASLFGAGLRVENAADMARQLEPIAGSGAKYLMGLGLFAAGLSSAITAPLATGFVAAELVGFPADPRAAAFRWVAGAVLAVGAVVAIAGARPVELILFAQAANGVLLPIIAAFLLHAANSRRLLGSHTNGRLANLAGGAVVAITAALGLRAILQVLGAG